MTCDFDNDLLRTAARGDAAGADRERVRAHVATCAACRDAFRGAEALALLAAREPETPAPDLFDRVVDTAVAQRVAARRVDRFWLGAGVGAVAATVAVTLVAVALLAGRPDASATPAVAAQAGAPSFVVSLQEPRQMALAFETDRALAGAEIEILLTGSVEIDGYGPQRELRWTEDLEAGVNRLSLPVIASGRDGGQMVVRLKHPQSRQTFVVHLPVET